MHTNVAGAESRNQLTYIPTKA
jgi:GntR family transcriptional regulator